MKPSAVQKAFSNVLSDAESDIASYVNNPDKDLTRHRICPFSDTVRATLCFSMNRTNTELFKYFFSSNKRVPTKSALIQQRKKLNPAFFPFLLKSFNQKVSLTRTYKGYHLVAVDGTDLNLPTDKNDTIYRVKQARSDNYYYQMHLNALFDICENRYISAITQPRPQMNERAAFCQLTKECSLPENTIFIADRGYISLITLIYLLENNRLFLIRGKTPGSSGSFLKNLLEPNVKADKVITLGVTRSRSKTFRKHPEKYKFIRKSQSFEPLDSCDSPVVYYTTIRCTCVRLSDGTYEYLISNLPQDRFSPRDLKQLYWKRWSVETSFRRLKYALSLSYLHSVNRELIIQEVYAKMILYNFSSLIHSYAEQSKELKHRNLHTKNQYHVSFDDVIPVARELLRTQIRDDIIKALLLQHLTAVKVNQASPRHMRSQTVKPLNNRA